MKRPGPQSRAVCIYRAYDPEPNHRIAAATSPGLHILPEYTDRITPSLCDCGNCSYIAVSVARVARFPRSGFVRLCQRSGCPVNADAEATLATRPCGEPSSAGQGTQSTLRELPSLPPEISRLCSAGIASRGSQYSTPALFTSVSITPIEPTGDDLAELPIQSNDPPICRQERTRGRETNAARPAPVINAVLMYAIHPSRG